MKYVSFILVILLFSFTLMAQDPKSHLLGACSRTDLQKEPYAEWFNANYNNYIPDTKITDKIKAMTLKDYSVKIFLGTWCGDSHREVPRFLKLLDEAGFPADAISLIALSSADSVYKQSPAHEEQGQHIYRVPTFIILKKGVEVNRIVEYPVTSLERDLLAILNGVAYTPNYRAYVYITQWLNEGLLTDDNVSHAGLANQIKHLLRNEGELNTAGYVLSRQGAEGMRAAVKVFRMNYYLYPESVKAATSLAEALGETGDRRRAAELVKRAAELNKDPKNVQYLFELYDVVRDRVE